MQKPWIRNPLDEDQQTVRVRNNSTMNVVKTKSGIDEINDGDAQIDGRRACKAESKNRSLNLTSFEKEPRAFPSAPWYYSTPCSKILSSLNKSPFERCACFDSVHPSQ